MYRKKYNLYINTSNYREISSLINSINNLQLDALYYRYIMYLLIVGIWGVQFNGKTTRDIRAILGSSPRTPTTHSKLGL